MSKYCLPFLFLLFTMSAKAQLKWISGYLKDSSTQHPIVGGTILNSGTKKKTQTDKTGFFRLKAAPNDVLYATANSYHFDTLRYSFMFTDTITIFLTPIEHMLPGVTVTSHYSQYQLDSLERRKAFDDMRGTKLNTVSSNNTGAFGVGLNLDRLFSKKYKDQKKIEKQFEETEQQAYVDYRFSQELVASYTGLTGDPLRDFIYRYTPSYKWLRQHPSDEDVLYYVNDKLKEYRGKKK